MQALDIALALFFIVSTFGYEIWVLSLTAYVAVVLLNDKSPRLRSILVWAILIGALLTAFNLVIVDLYVTIEAYRNNMIAEWFWQGVTVDFIYLLFIAGVTAVPVIHESRKRRDLSRA